MRSRHRHAHGLDLANACGVGSPYFSRDLFPAIRRLRQIRIGDALSRAQSTTMNTFFATDIAGADTQAGQRRIPLLQRTVVGRSEHRQTSGTLTCCLISLTLRRRPLSVQNTNNTCANAPQRFDLINRRSRQWYAKKSVGHVYSTIAKFSNIPNVNTCRFSTLNRSLLVMYENPALPRLQPLRRCRFGIKGQTRNLGLPDKAAQDRQVFL